MNRLKTLKRQMYGRAGVVLQRQRLLHDVSPYTDVAEGPDSYGYVCGVAMVKPPTARVSR